MTQFQPLLDHHAKVAGRSILSLFGANRAQHFSVAAEGLLFDYSKTNIDETGLGLLLALAEGAGLSAKREAMFSGAKINETEGRAVLHTALRAGPEAVVKVDGADVMPEVRAIRARMMDFVRAVRDGSFKGPVSYTHLRAHETRHDLVCRLLLEKNFFNDTATTEIYTLHIVGSVRCV